MIDIVCFQFNIQYYNDETHLTKIILFTVNNNNNNYYYLFSLI